jgi:hypothetical protein
MRADLAEQKIPVDLSSRDEGEPFGTKNPVDLSSHEGGPLGTINCLGPVIKSNVSFNISH